MDRLDLKDHRELTLDIICHVGRTQISRAVSYGWKGVTSLVFAACWLGEAMVLQECDDFHTGDKRLYLFANLALLGRCVIFSHEQSTCNPDDEAMSQTSEKKLGSGGSPCCGTVSRYRFSCTSLSDARVLDMRLCLKLALIIWGDVATAFV